jgi:transposase-like protein
VAKKTKKRTTYDAAFKAGVVKRALEAKRSGGETVEAIAKDLGIARANIDNWLKVAKAKRASPVKTVGKKGNGAAALPAIGTSISALSRDLDAALANVSAIKKRLRAMLGDE